tara:strand:- start:379 stop:750 length:372 start_codon:yes stop_codon:yes gene_type:complete
MNKLANFEAVYEKEEDMLFVYSKRNKTKESVEVMDDIVIDLDKDNNLVGIEVYDASKFFNSMDSKINEEILEKLKEVKVGIKKYRNYVFITIVFNVEGLTLSEKLPGISLREYESPLITSVSA